MHGFTITASRPSAIPRYTSISASYLLMAYAEVFFPRCPGQASRHATRPPAAARSLLWNSHDTSVPPLHPSAAFTTLAVPPTFTRCIAPASRGSKETIAAQWYTCCTPSIASSSASSRPESPSTHSIRANSHVSISTVVTEHAFNDGTITSLRTRPARHRALRRAPAARARPRCLFRR